MEATAAATTRPGATSGLGWLSIDQSPAAGQSASAVHAFIVQARVSAQTVPPSTRWKQVHPDASGPQPTSSPEEASETGRLFVVSTSEAMS